MAGLGRRTHYRKHLTDKVLHDLPIPSEHERVAKVMATRGSNQFDILLPSETDEATRTPQLAILPTKFRKLVWLKRNDFVIVQTGGDEEDELADGHDEKQEAAKSESKGVRYIINHILYKEQVKNLRSKGLWPTDDPEFADSADAAREESEDDLLPRNQTEPLVSDDGIVYGFDGDSEDENFDDDLFVNTNRIASLAVEDSSDSDEDD